MNDDKYEIFISTLGIDLLQELLVIFENQFKEALVELSKCMLERRHKDASMLAHTLKSSAKNVGAIEIGEIFHSIEKRPEEALGRESLNNLVSLYEEFRQETKKFWTDA